MLIAKMYNKKPSRLKDKQIFGVERSLPIPNGLAMDELYTNGYSSCYDLTSASVYVVLGFDVPPTAEVIRRRDLGLKSLIRKTGEARDRTHDP